MAEELKRLSILERLGYERIEGFSDERKVGVLISLLSLMIVTAAIAISRGVYEISVVDVYTITLAHLSPIVDVSTVNKLQNTIVWDLRIPRILLAITVGVALATSGAVFQGCVRNPLVDRYILGGSIGGDIRSIPS